VPGEQFQNKRRKKDSPANLFVDRDAAWYSKYNKQRRALKTLVSFPSFTFANHRQIEELNHVYGVVVFAMLSPKGKALPEVEYPGPRDPSNPLMSFHQLLQRKCSRVNSVDIADSSKAKT
jgi:hypothetical protein